MFSVRFWPKIAAGEELVSVCFAEISWLWRGKFLSFGFALAISNKFAKADTQNPFTSGG
jgi:hypothetical protein